MHWSSFGATPDTRFPLTTCWSNWCQRSGSSLFPQITAFSHKSCPSWKMIISSQAIWGGNCWSQTWSLMSGDVSCVSEFRSGGSQRGSRQQITVLFLREHIIVDIKQDCESQTRSWSKSMHFIWYLGMVPVWSLYSAASEYTKIPETCQVKLGASMSYKRGTAAALWISREAGLEVNSTLLCSYLR